MHAVLHQTLASALQQRDRLASAQASQQLAQTGFTEEASLVGRMFLHDFERFGVHLAPLQQRKALELTMQVHTAGACFGAHSP